MSNPKKIRSLLEPLADASDVELPSRFAEAVSHVRQAIALCERANIPNDTLLSALMTELMPRLVSAYGPSRVAFVFERLADEMSGAANEAPAVLQ